MTAPAPILTQLTTVTMTNAVASPITIGGVKSIKGIGSGKAKEIPTTTLASTAAEFVQGLRDFGSVTMELVRNEDDAGQAEMFSANALQATRVFVVTLPTSAANVITFSGFIVNITTDIDADNIVTGQVDVRITGPIVYS